MDFETFKKAVDSMKGYKGIVGIMGGEPTLHPQFRQFVEYFRENFGHDDFTNAAYKPQRNFIKHICDNVFHITENNQRGLWSTVGKFYAKNFELIQDTFGYQALNDHSQPSYHESLMITRKEIGIPDEEWYALRDNCWVQRLWSSSITPKGAFFCEIAAALDMLLDGPGGWPIEPGWWKRTPDEFGDQLKWCELCGAALPMPKRNANEEIDDVSPYWQELLVKVRSPKFLNNKTRLFDVSTYNKEDYKVIDESLPYLKDQSKRIKNSYKYIKIQDLGIILDIRKMSEKDIAETLKMTPVNMFLVEGDNQINLAKQNNLPYIEPSKISPLQQKELLQEAFKNQKWVLLARIPLRGNPVSVFNQYVLNPGCLLTKNSEYQLFNIEAQSLEKEIDLDNLVSHYPERKSISVDYVLNPKFTIIVPVYNVEKYLQNLYKMLSKQTVKDFEVIFVNDCSTDNSRAILEDIFASDLRIRIFDHDENSCQGIARNTGLDNALGEYVLYIDADDKIPPNYIETLYAAIQKDDADLVICNSIWDYPFEREKRNNFITKPHTKYLVMDNKECLKRFFNLYEKDVWVPVEPWGKMIKRSVIEENKLRHPQGLMEDIVMTFQELIYCKKIAFINDYLYIYNRKNTQAMTLKEKGRYIKAIPNAVGGIINFLKERGLWEEYSDIAKMYYLRYLNSLYSFFSKGEDLKEEMIEAMKVYAGLIDNPLDVENVDAAANYVLGFYEEMKQRGILEAFDVIAEAHPDFKKFVVADSKV